MNLSGYLGLGSWSAELRSHLCRKTRFQLSVCYNIPGFLLPLLQSKLCFTLVDFILFQMKLNLANAFFLLSNNSLLFLIHFLVLKFFLSIFEFSFELLKSLTLIIHFPQSWTLNFLITVLNFSFHFFIYAIFQNFFLNYTF